MPVPSAPHRRDIVVIGASAGGVPALQRLVEGLPPSFPAAVLIVLHTWPHAQSFLPAILERAGNMPVEHGHHDEPIKPGRIYIAPVDHHLMVEDGRLFITQGPRENRFRPAINPLFRSAALAHRERVIGVILTGMLEDGAAGMWAVKECGGVGIAQSDAEFDEMPRRAIERAEVDHIVPLAEIAPLLVRLTAEPLAPSSPKQPPPVILLNDAKSKMKSTDIAMDQVGRRSLFTCPECNGALWELHEGPELLYACHVGHSYTPRGLDEAQTVVIEQSLWSAVRSLKENAAMHQRLADRAAESGLLDAAENYLKVSKLRLDEARRIRGLIGHRDSPSGHGGAGNGQSDPPTI